MKKPSQVRIKRKRHATPKLEAGNVVGEKEFNQIIRELDEHRRKWH
jgi:hypothetical protein